MPRRSAKPPPAHPALRDAEDQRALLVEPCRYCAGCACTLTSRNCPRLASPLKHLHEHFCYLDEQIKALDK